jgi:hypothetical protein
VSLNKLGDVKLRVGTESSVGEAFVHYEESLEVCRRIISEFGESPDRLRDVSISLERLGDVKLRVGTESSVGEAFVHYEESLDVRRRIISEFGESPDRLRDVSVSLFRLVSIEDHRENSDGVCIRVSEVIDIMNKLTYEYKYVDPQLKQAREWMIELQKKHQCM